MGGWDDATIDWYVREHGNAPVLKALITAASVPLDANVVEIGCGSGAALRLLAEDGHRRLTGVEPFPRMLEHARRQTREAGLGARIKFLQASAEFVPIEPRSVDVVLAFNVLPHVAEQETVLSEASRLLKDGGVLLVGGDDYGGPDRDGPLSDELARVGFAAPDWVDVDGGIFARAELRSDPALRGALKRYPGAETFAFGDNPALSEDLLRLVRSGHKTATCGALRDFETGGAPRPVIGRRDLALEWDGRPALVIETVSVEETRYCDVTAAFALAEGETETLEGWQRDHRDYFERNGGWSSDMMLLCERFRLVEDLAADV